VVDTADMMAMQYLNQLPEQRRLEFQMAFQAQKKERTTALLLSLILGHIGVDRFYLGQTGLGLFKLLTLGGCGVWLVIDWFLIMGATDQRNIAELQKLQMMYGALSPQPSYPQLSHHGGYGPPPGGGYGPPPGGGYGPPPQ
jgi:TM2 domain-containing membrane protein YozV